MSKFTQEQLKEIYKKLPGDLKDAIFSVDSAKIIQETGKKYGLTIDKIGELADETGLVMLGLSAPSQFIPNLAVRLNVNKETARKIAADINTQIFAKVRESLKKVHGIAQTTEGVGAPPPPPPPILPIKEETDIHPAKIEILKELENDSDEKIPDILKGASAPEPLPDPFSAKTKEWVFRLPPEQKRYEGVDPYRESVN